MTRRLCSASGRQHRLFETRDAHTGKYSTQCLDCDLPRITLSREDEMAMAVASYHSTGIPARGRALVLAAEREFYIQELESWIVTLLLSAQFDTQRFSTAECPEGVPIYVRHEVTIPAPFQFGTEFEPVLPSRRCDAPRCDGHVELVYRFNLA